MIVLQESWWNGTRCLVFPVSGRSVAVRMASVLLSPYAGREGRLGIRCGVAPSVQPRAFPGAANRCGWYCELSPF